MTNTTFSHRWAKNNDIGAIKTLMHTAITHLQTDYLSPEQVEASKEGMGLDTQLIADGTYLLIECEGELVGCGGWSNRTTLFGGNHTSGRDEGFLDPAHDAARIRAMYTHPQWTRQGIGKKIIQICEDTAKENGFKKTILMATLSGEPLYLACGYEPIEQVNFKSKNRVLVPMTKMGKTI